MDFTKIDSGNVELEWLPFDLSDCFEETFDLMSGLAKDKQLALNYDLDPNLPQKVVGDMTRLRQILINLLGNAIKFTNSGSVFLSVNLLELAEPNQHQLLFTVKDTGIGIPNEQMGLLFKPISQVDTSTTRKFGGTGLGLAICKNLVELMGGEIWAEPAKEGATFVFTIITLSADNWTRRQETTIVGASKIRQDFSQEMQPKIIAVTSNAFTEDREKCLKAGMDGYLSKPIRRTELLAVLNRIF
ncbi:ATP-binding protein [Paenibacillus sp. LPE1-1-1.1]|uniref:ATP-binding protein n=1 Tax=Paenibacillus sp. LPE1-1-1.1 TaxID=3135230 RepID=UPI0034205748